MKTISQTPLSHADFSAEPLRAHLRRQLLTLNYHAFVQCVCLLLNAHGYEGAQPAGRTNWKGRNQGGGYDIEAFLSAGVGRRRVIVQAKQFDRLAIFQRSVDELRGTCLRAGAHEALLITTSTFSPIVRQNAVTGGPQIAPVRLIDGEALLDLMLRHRIGVREEARATKNGTRSLHLDQAFFAEIAHRYANRERLTTPARAKESLLPRWFVTIQVTSPDNSGSNYPRKSGV